MRNFTHRKNTIIKCTSLFLSFCLISCLTSQNQDLEDALTMAGKNRNELEKVLTHYKADPEKLKAAEFLIRNMPGFYSRVDVNGKYENLYRQAEEIIDSTVVRDAKDSKKVKMQIDRLELNQTSALDSVSMDIRTITAGFLIQNIEEAFYLREHSPWCRHLTFDEFCEYILPYKIANYFFLDPWREKLSRRVRKELLDRMDTYKYSSLLNESSYWACKEVNSYLHQYQYPQHCPLAASDIYRLTILGKVPYGTCEEKIIATTGIMRSLGIPVSIGFTYQWPFRSLGHSWNILLMKNGLLTTFGGGDQGPEEMHMPEIPMVKAYKRTYAINKDLVQLRKEMKIIPDAFKDVHVQDVSRDHMGVTDVKIPSLFKSSAAGKYAYLAVFNDKEWIPVCYGKKKGKDYIFEDIGKGNVYLPVHYTKDGVIPFNHPFILHTNGEIQFLIPDEENKQNAILKRKFFLSEVMHQYTEKLIGGEFQASEREDFAVAESIYRIDKWNNRKDSVIVQNSTPYRYWRYVAPENSNGNISHIDFFSEGISITHQGNIIGTNETFFPDDISTAKDVVFDKNPLTYFNTPDSIRNPWVGMDFGKPVQIDKIVYAPRNDDNNIRPGDFYELFFWKEDWWVSLGRKTAQKDYLEYQHIPTDCLFLLKNYTRGKEERIFTYKDNEQVFW